MNKLATDKKLLLQSLIFPLIFVLILWLVKFAELGTGESFAFLGVYPRALYGLPGIIFSPLIHGDFEHLYANSAPILVLMTTLFYFYRKIAFKIFFLIYLFSTIWVWIAGRESYHIGASGLIYGLAAFLFVSGILRKNPQLLAITLLVTFLYGGIIWGIVPDFYPEKNISWESHLLGMVAGVSMAFYFRNTGPQRKKYSWELEEEAGEGDIDDEDAYWNRNDEVMR